MVVEINTVDNKTVESVYDIFLTTEHPFLQSDEATYGIDYEGPTPSEEWHGALLSNENNTVEVPPTGCPLNDSDWQELNRNYDPTRESLYHGGCEHFIIFSI